MEMGIKMRVISISLLIFLLVNLILAGCTTCHDKIVSMHTQGIWNADVKHRVCGSYSGYSVAVYKASERPPGYGEGDKEPFQAMYKTEDYKEGPVPIRIKWETDNHLLIHHDTRLSLDDDKSKPMIIKAETSYSDIFIKYDPEPVLWDR
jgi:hypothetical protein